MEILQSSQWASSVEVTAASSGLDHLLCTTHSWAKVWSPLCFRRGHVGRSDHEDDTVRAGPKHHSDHAVGRFPKIVQVYGVDVLVGACRLSRRS